VSNTRENLATILPSAFSSTNLAEFEDEFYPESDDTFAADLVAGSIAVTLTFV